VAPTTVVARDVGTSRVLRRVRQCEVARGSCSRRSCGRDRDERDRGSGDAGGDFDRAGLAERGEGVLGERAPRGFNGQVAVFLDIVGNR
jgi:hypothetical protein